MIAINLKEIFPVDDQTGLAAKLNFNFNQLLSLGFGLAGPMGPIGPSGPAGPIGPIGETGIPGSQIFSTSSSGLEDLGAADPVDAIIGDYYISTDKIYKKAVSVSGAQWEVISNFNTIFSNIASVGTSTWQLGAVTGTPDNLSKLLTPIKNYGQFDRISTPGSSGEWATNDPNWYSTSGNTTNSQVTLYNFDPEAVKIYNSVNSDQNSYGVNVTASRLGSSGAAAAENAFPYSSLLSLYSFYSSNLSSDEADQFSPVDGTSGIGHRHQLELGSVDNIVEEIVSTSLDAQYVVSPTWQNLRIRKYRSTSGLAGGAVIKADFNLHSGDNSTSPALNSKFTWRINKKTNASVNSGSNIELALSSSTVEGEASNKLTGITVDGLHLKSGSYNLAIGVDPLNAGQVKNAVIASDSTNSITNLVVRNMNLTMVNTVNNSTSVLSTAGLSSNRSIAIATTGPLANITINPGVTGRSVFITTPNSAGSIYLGNSTSGTSDSWASNSGFAIKTRGNRLAAGLPFPVSTGALPTASSNDNNVLDEYMEMSFNPEVGFDTTLPFTAPASSIASGTSGLGPDFGDDTLGRFIKIGRFVHFDVTFSITNWRAKRPSPNPYAGGPKPGSAERDTQFLNYGNVGTGSANPFANLTLGGEPNYLFVRGIPDHYPFTYNPMSSASFRVIVSADAPGEPGLRGNPFYYSWGGTGSNGTSGTMNPGTGDRWWFPLDPASVHARMTTYTTSGTSLPQLQLYGNRRLYRGTSLLSKITDAVSPVLSKVTIWDFLTPFASNRKVYVTITGSYLTNHQTAQQTVPGGSTNQIPSESITETTDSQQ